MCSEIATESPSGRIQHDLYLCKASLSYKLISSRLAAFSYHFQAVPRKLAIIHLIKGKKKRDWVERRIHFHSYSVLFAGAL